MVSPLIHVGCKQRNLSNSWTIIFAALQLIPLFVLICSIICTTLSWDGDQVKQEILAAQSAGGPAA